MKASELQTILSLIMNANPKENKIDRMAIGQIAQAAYFKLNYGQKKLFQRTNNLKENEERY